jgi:molybdopterin converting factor small subunit
LKVSLRLYGVFRSAAGSEKVELNLALDEPTVQVAIADIATRSDLTELKKLVLDGETLDPRPNALIMVSGREISTLDGLDTRLKVGDELALLPIAHGG